MINLLLRCVGDRRPWRVCDRPESIRCISDIGDSRLRCVGDWQTDVSRVLVIGLMASLI